MPRSLPSKVREQLAARIEYYREMGIYDFYARPAGVADVGEAACTAPAAIDVNSGTGTETPIANADAVVNLSDAAGSQSGAEILADIRADIGDCRRCRLHQGRNNLVFGVGDPNAELMFVGEALGADEDVQGVPFVGRAGQLLSNMIAAMGLKRDDVYIANIIKCRPPQNRTPERDECETCSPFLMRQIAAIRPKVIVALGAVAAKTLLAMNASMAELRGRFYDFTPRGASELGSVKLAVTYHPAFLLRDPRQKKETWKDLQMVMNYLGLKPPAKPAE